ncbi:hypothetical protein Bbelb_414690 [Branchiostoma belcheri]|nr:hypothetical protein Bbelb_414690 [Branchiostoma belcheri]
MASTPLVLIASCTPNFQAEGLVKQIIGKDDLPPGVAIVEKMTGFPWTIDNKYYTANVHICIALEKTIGNAEFAEALQAVILHFDSKEAASFESVKQWLPFLTHLDVDVKLLTCGLLEQEGAVLTREDVFTWCIENGFELVELQESQDRDEEDVEDSFYPDPVGVKRIVSALHAHTWPNLELKDTSSDNVSRLMALLHEREDQQAGRGDAEGEEETESRGEPEGAENGTQVVQGATGGSTQVQNSSSSKKSPKKKQATREERIDKLVGEDMSIISGLANEYPGGESFEAMFDRMKDMKDKAANLPDQDRKAYAEKVAISFWRAMGGDEEEIEGLSDSDEQ